MKLWFKRVILIVTIGGGFQGFVEAVQAFLALQSKTPTAVILCSIIAAFFLLAIVAGLRFAENAKHTSALILVLLLQIPLIYSPILGYELNTAVLAVLKFAGGKLGWGVQLGSDHRLLVGYEMPWGIGLNIFPVVLLVLLGVFTRGDRQPTSN
jgi:hypothetical protein